MYHEARTTAFIWNGSDYYSPVGNDWCPLAGSWYDGANCYVQAAPTSDDPFIYQDSWYYSTVWTADTCDAESDPGRRILVHRAPAEAELQLEIGELLAAGTKHLWVVRLTGPRRVEIHEPRKKMRLAHPGDELVAPGILKNPVLVEALFDRDAAHEATLRNLLQRRGYESLDDVRREGEREGAAEGALEGRRQALFTVVAARSLTLSAAQRELILGSTDADQLDQWILRAATAESAAVVFERSRLGKRSPSTKRGKPRAR